MKMNFTNRDRKLIGMIVSILVSSCLIVTYLLCKLSGIGGEIAVSAVQFTSLAQDIVAFERDNFTLSLYLLAAVQLFAVLFITAFTSRRTFFPQGVYLQPIIYTALMLAVSSMSNHPLIVASTLLITLFATCEIYSINHTSYATSIYSDTPTSFKLPMSRLFVVALYLGLLSLIHPAAVSLLLVFPVLIFCFDRYFYEVFVPLIGFFVPMVIEMYIRWWLYDANVEILLDRYRSMLEVNDSIFSSWSNYTELLQQSYPTTFIVILSLLLSCLGLARILQYSITARAHQRFVFSFALFIAGIIMTYLASFSISMLLIIAAPVAILITAALINLRAWVMSFIYAFYIILTLIAIL